MHIYECVYIHIYVYIYIYTFLNVCTYNFKFTHFEMSVYMILYIHSYMYVQPFFPGIPREACDSFSGEAYSSFRKGCGERQSLQL